MGGYLLKAEDADKCTPSLAISLSCAILLS